MMRSGFMSKTTTLQNIKKNKKKIKWQPMKIDFGILTARKQDTR
jgi:hypothetical protein